MLKCMSNYSKIKKIKKIPPCWNFPKYNRNIIERGTLDSPKETNT
jgi:hypothetical protein